MIYKQLVLDAAVKAGKEILKIYNSKNFAVELKGDNSPLTRADKEANEIIVSELQKTGIPILSEEGQKIPYETRKTWKSFWLVDPLDGTKEFIKRNGEFTVNIALIENNKPVFGVVYAPILDKLFFGGTKVNAAYLITNKQKTELKRKENKSKTIRIVASRSHLNQATQDFIDKFENVETISMGSSLKFMILAEGNADFYPRFAPTMEWDTGAAHAIIDVLGFEVVNPDTNKKLFYNKENLLNPYFLVK